MSWVESSEVIDDGDCFFDSREQFSVLNSESDDDWCSTSGFGDSASPLLGYQMWVKNFGSVKGRRIRFLRWLEATLQHDIPIEENFDSLTQKFNCTDKRIFEGNGAGVGTSPKEDDYDGQDPSMPSRSDGISKVLPYNLEYDENYAENMHDKTVSSVERHHNYASVERHHNLSSVERRYEVASNQLSPIGEIRRNSRSSRHVRESFPLGKETSCTPSMTRKIKISLLKKLGVSECFTSNETDSSLVSNAPDSLEKVEFKTVTVYLRKKKSKELSSLHAGQILHAHEGSILTMKFSPDGQYLATGGEDGIVRVWKVVEQERSNRFNISDINPSCLYFSVDGQSKLSPLDLNKLDERNQANKSTSTCVIFPEKLFHLLEEPLHVFSGHLGDVLDLSWSSNGFLLSASVDKTVRLWRVGYNQCVQVFSHNNYVTCVEFNPVDDNYFISGSIDGKVRIWEVINWRVVDWIDIKGIATAVCYRPDGKGGIIGLMTGCCHFFDVRDNQLYLDKTICLQGKRKLTTKRISGFQFCPGDPGKVMITCAGSRIRVFDGAHMICKFSGLRSGGTHISASFTEDGRHIVSSDGDSNITIWNYDSTARTRSKPKHERSCESFSAYNSSIMLPWYGLKVSSSPSPTSFSLAAGFLPPKGAATWPEEKLSSAGTLCKSDYRLVKSACNGTSHSPHMWGLVIVTAGRDGKLRTFHNYGLPVHI